MAPLPPPLLPCREGATGPERGPSVPPSSECARVPGHIARKTSHLSPSPNKLALSQPRPLPPFKDGGQGLYCGGSPPKRGQTVTPLHGRFTGAFGTVPGEVTPAKHFASSLDYESFYPHCLKFQRHVLGNVAFIILFLIFIYLAMLALSCKMWDLSLQLTDALVVDTGSVAVVHELNYSPTYDILVSGPGIQPASSVLQDRFLTTEPSGKYPLQF